MRRPHPSLAALLLATLAGPLAAEPAVLVTDLDSRADPSFGASPEPIAVFNGKLYFWSTDPVTGAEPWKSDGTPAGTALLEDVCPGRCGSRPRSGEAAVAGGLLFFTACDGARGCQLWKTDGSGAGTELVEAFEDDGLTPPVRRLAAWNGALYFAAADVVHGVELFRTDGTREGTTLVRDLSPGRRSTGFTDLVAAEDRLFVATVDGLWTSDGTAAGTERILELPAGRSSGFLNTAVGGRLFYTTRGTGLEDALWTSDGTAAGTVKLRDAVGSISGLVPLEGEALFFDNSDSGVELWTTDGTAAGTARVRGGLSNIADPLAVFAGELYFANRGTLWRSDGTPAGTRIANRFVDSVIGLGVAGDALYALTWSLGETAVWRTLGTAATTERVLGGAAGRFEEMLAFGDRLALAVERDGEGEELALLDPATGDLAFLTDAVQPGSADPKSLTEELFRLLFVTGDGLHGTRGTEDATEFVASSSPAARLVRAAGGTFVFDGDELGFLDLRGQRSQILAGNNRNAVDAELSVTVGEELFFLAFFERVDGYRYELFRSDGRRGRPATHAAAGIPNNHFCFDPPCTPVSVDVAARGDEVFVLHQTRLLRADLSRRSFDTVFDAEELAGCDVDEGLFCQLEDLAVAGGRLFFTSAGTDVPLVLWTSDGTADGTRRVRELLPPPIFDPRPVRELLGVGETLYFVFPDPEVGEELWASDGTEAGTAVVRDLRPGPRSSFPRGLTAFDGRLVFAADDGAAGHEPWTSDGTGLGTVRVADVCAGPCSSLPRDFTAVGGVLVFAADDGVAGAEPWRTDLTAAGTWRIDDVSPGPSPSGPRDFTAAYDRVYFNAAAEATGFELFSFPRVALLDAAEPCPECLAGGRFRVRVDWADPRGVRGAATPIVHDDHNAFFWFFGPDNVELLVKVLNGTSINDHYWVFYGALSAVEYTITVEDRQTGRVQTYHNPPGNICGRGDVGAFPAGGGASPLRPAAPAAKQAACGGDDRTLCLDDGRFRVEVEWTDPRGVRGTGRALPLTDATGAFWFFGPKNLELVVKLLDGTGINGRYWFFYGGLSSVEYTITVTDTRTGAVRVYRNEAGEICGRGDVEAF